MSDKERQISKSLFSTGGLILVLLILVVVNIIFSRINLRWDLTEEKLYSLSGGTQTILSNLKNDVTIKVFYSESVSNVPAYIKNFAKSAIDFLGEYERKSGGRVAIEVYDPKIDSDEEEWAQKYGIEAVELPTGDRIYFGLVAVSADQQETIKRMDPTAEERLEYDITRIISRVQSAKLPKIGVISDLPVFGAAANPYTRQPQMPTWQVVTELKKTYEVENISGTTEKIDDDIRLLVVIHPRRITDQLLFAVDQYVLNGGNVIVFVDPFSTVDPLPGSVKASSFEKLFKAWGVEMDKTKTVADLKYSTKIRNRAEQVEDNPFWLSLHTEALNTEDLITAKLESVLLPMAGAIRKAKDSPHEYEPLLQSSTDAALEESMRARMTAIEIRSNFKAADEQFDLAAKISGVFSTAFPEGKPKKEAADKEKPAAEKDKTEAQKQPALAKGKKPATIIVVADSDLLFDGYYVHKQNFLGFEVARIFNDNLNLVLNSVEMLAGGQELISIRSRGKFEKPFIKVLELEKKAQVKWLAREQELVRKVEETNQKLAQLEQQKDASQKLIISKEQEAEIQKFQAEKLRIRKELKIVRRNLRAEIESLGVAIKAINIFLMPLLVCIVGIAYAVYKRKRSMT